MDTQKVVKKIFEVTIKHEVDTSPDTSYLGEYTDELKPGVVVRTSNEFYEKLPRIMERNADGTFAGKGDLIEHLPERDREYRGFKPYAGGEKVGTKNYYKYGMRDYWRMEHLNEGDWCYIGIVAKAQVGVSLDGGKTFICNTITSGGLWGVESDSDKDFIAEVESEELSQLKGLLLAYGFGRSKVAKALKGVDRVDE